MTEEIKPELLPCPMCQSRAKEFIQGTASCTNDFCYMKLVYCPIKEWNTRTDIKETK